MFISIDGGDGSGKGRQLELLKSALSARGLETVSFRDPGDSALGETLRSILLERKEFDIAARAETALFMAARAQLVSEKIKPALNEGKIVLMDRYVLSTVVYQGCAVGADDETLRAIWDMGRYFTDGVMPDLTFVLDCPSDVAFQRLARPKDKIESRGEVFHRRAVDGYRRMAAEWERFAPGEARLIDATLAPEEVFERIFEALKEKLALD